MNETPACWYPRLNWSPPSRLKKIGRLNRGIELSIGYVMFS